MDGVRDEKVFLLSEFKTNFLCEERVLKDLCPF